MLIADVSDESQFVPHSSLPLLPLQRQTGMNCILSSQVKCPGQTTRRCTMSPGVRSTHPRVGTTLRPLRTASPRSGVPSRASPPIPTPLVQTPRCSQASQAASTKGSPTRGGIPGRATPSPRPCLPSCRRPSRRIS